jgi:type IV secretion system protein VirB9
VAHKRRQPPLWAPVRVFDDGRRTYIEFSDKSAAIASPPLFMTQPDGSDALANYRVRDDYYIVDRVISKAELKFGKNPADVVTITAETSHD